MRKDRWVWMPHAAHLIVGEDCRFHLATYVGKYLVSTVGEYLPDEKVREIHAKLRKKYLKGEGDQRRADFIKKFGYMEIGYGRIYETMVFKAKRAEWSSCCPWTMKDPSDLDFAGYNRREKAYQGHLEMCEKWSKK